MAKQSIIFICQVFHPNQSSTSQLFSPVMKRLASNGYDVKVLCGFTQGARDENLASDETWENVSIKRCGLNVDHKRGIIFRMVAYLSFLIHVFFHLFINCRNADIWLGVTNPPFNAWAMYIAAKLCKTKPKIVFMLLDLHPEGLIALGKLRSASIFVTVWRILNRRAYRAMDRLIVLGRDMIPIISKNYNICREKISYIPHWSAVTPQRPINFSESKRAAKLQVSGNCRVIQYSGNMGLWHDIETFVEAAKILENEDIIFHFIGDGIKKKAAQRLHKRLKCKNIMWSGFVPFEELEDSLAACHISLISLIQGLEGVAVPCKLYGILASGRPVLAQVPLDSEIALTIQENHCGVVVKPGDAYELAKTIRRIIHDDILLTQMGNNSFKSYMKNYQISQGVDALLNIFNELES